MGKRYKPPVQMPDHIGMIERAVEALSNAEDLFSIVVQQKTKIDDRGLSYEDLTSILEMLARDIEKFTGRKRRVMTSEIYDACETLRRLSLEMRDQSSPRHDEGFNLLPTIEFLDRLVRLEFGIPTRTEERK